LARSLDLLTLDTAALKRDAQSLALIGIEDAEGNAWVVPTIRCHFDANKQNTPWARNQSLNVRSQGTVPLLGREE
jgi:hypothetical protein